MSAKCVGQFGLTGEMEVSDYAAAAAMIMRIEDTEAKRLGRRISDVRPSIARRIRTGAATLANIRKQRRKTIPSWLMSAIRSELIRVLQREVHALECEISIHANTHAGNRNDDLAKAEAQLASARELLKGRPSHDQQGTGENNG